MVEAAMSDCLTLFHETTLLANIKTRPEMDLLLSMQPAKLELEYPMISK